MKKLFYTIILIALHGTVHSQEINGDTILVLKGGISVLNFAAKIIDFQIEKKEDYSLQLENENVLRIWPKVGLTNPGTTRLFVAEGKRNHIFVVYFKEKGDYHSTTYDFRSLKKMNSNTSFANLQTEEEKVVQAPKIPEGSGKHVKANDKQFTFEKNETKAVLPLEKKVPKEVIPPPHAQASLGDDKAKVTKGAKTEDDQLNARLLAEKKSNEALEKKLIADRNKLSAKEKALALEVQQRQQKEVALEKTRNEIKAKEEKLLEERKQREEAKEKLLAEQKKKIALEKIAKKEREKFIPPPAEIDIRKKFPAINFLEPPIGQFFEGNYFGDTMAYFKASQSYLTQQENSKYQHATTEIDQIRISLQNIHFSGKAAYLTFQVENKTNNYFILGATLFKILEAETGKSYQLNPYYISSFPIIESHTKASFVYVMKIEQTISHNSFVILSLRERQSNKKYELTFEGSLYTDALKAAEK